MKFAYWHWDQVFEKKPQQWGLRGDPYVWQSLQGEVESKYPRDYDEAVEELHLCFREITGWDLRERGRPSVVMTQFKFGGMSSGACSLDVWRARLMPMLVRRVGKVIASEASAETYDLFSQRLEPFAQAVMLKNNLLRTQVLSEYQRAQVLASMSDDLRKSSDIVVGDLRPCRTSVAAAHLANHVDLSKATWHDQPKFDPGRKLLMFEHVSPVSQIREECRATSTVDEILLILWQNLRVAWITKEENKALTKLGYDSRRPTPLRAYAESGILLT